jgi:hypothetical protein
MPINIGRSAVAALHRSFETALEQPFIQAHIPKGIREHHGNAFVLIELSLL